MKAKEPALAYKAKKKTYTYQDWLELPEDSYGHEIINGELVMSPSPQTVHQDVSRNLFFELLKYNEIKQAGIFYNAPFDVVLDDTHIVQPDLLYISNGRKALITEKNIQGAPDLIVEIISPATAYRDMFDKKELYEKFGVCEYWIIDPLRRWMENYRLKDGRFFPAQKLEKNGQIESGVLPALKLRLEKLF